MSRLRLPHLCLFAALCAVALGGGLPGLARADHDASKPTRITLLQINDVYTLNPVDGGKRGGMAKVATLVRKIRQENPNTLFFLAGDTLSPSVASALFQGRHMVEGLNAAGIDVATLGNHEFDYGTKVLRKRLKESKFEWICANTFESDGKTPFAGLKPWVIKDLGGVKVGIFGVVTVGETMRGDLDDVRFTDPLDAAEKAVSELKAAGAEVLIALTHLDLIDDRSLARRFPEIQVIIGGHEHEVISLMVGPTLVTKAGSDARNLARVDIDVSRGEGKVFVDRRLRLIPIEGEIEKDRFVDEIAQKYEKKLQKELSQVLGRTKEPLDVRASHVRNNEAAVGNFIADSMVAATGADLALVNSGSMRSDRIIQQGRLTRRDVLSVLPFGNKVVTIEMTGQALMDTLEYAVGRVGQSFGRFLQVSGIRFTVDPNKVVGARVSEVRVRGLPLNTKRRYKVATVEFLQMGGDGYKTFAGAKTQMAGNSGPLLASVVMDAVKKRKKIAPRVDGRIKVQGTVRREGGPVRVIADVDPGVDSAMALLYLLRNPKVELLGVTVVNGITTVEAGTRNVAKLLQATGRTDVPVGVGRAQPIVGTQKYPEFWREEADRKTSKALPGGAPELKTEPAEELIHRLAEKYPGEAIFVSLGPMTNLAAAMTRYPKLKTQLKEVVFMGGAAFVEGNLERPFVGIHNKAAEWNVYVDPHAAAMVVDSGLPVTMVALDATNRAPVTRAFIERLSSHDLEHDPVVQIMLRLFNVVDDAVRSGWYFFWDPLAAVAAVNRSVIDQEEHNVTIITAEGEHFGQTKVVGRGGTKVVIAVDTHIDAFEDAFLRPLVP